MQNSLIIIIFSIFFIFNTSAQSNPTSEKDIETKIQAIQTKLNIIKNDLNLAYGEEQKIIEQLEFHDQQINRIVNEANRNQLELDELHNQISNYSSQIKKKDKAINSQKSDIVNLLKLQIYLNHDKTLKMLLMSPQYKQKDLIKHQLKYLQNQLYKLIRDVALEVKELNKIKANLIGIQNIEKIKQQELVKQKSLLSQEKSKRLIVLSQLKSQIKTKEIESKVLAQDQNRLQELLKEIINLMSDLPDDLGKGLNFADLKGHILQPITGKILRSFNSFRSENTRWNGIVIQSSFNTPVKAVAYGRVAYAEWLRGFGMLVIIDHQNGYMTLYGFNQSIEVEIGDWVQPQQTIATVGSSGTIEAPTLYFEIRKDAEPQNPKKWLKK